MQISARATVLSNVSATFMRASLIRATMAAISVTLLLIHSSNVYASEAGSNAATLAPCPPSPNCVSSQATDEEHFIEPLSGANTPAEALGVLTRVLDALDRVKWTATSDNHIQATFTSLILRFVDDVDFIIEEDASITVRSASRVGHSDFGANRNRIEMLREKFTQALRTPNSAPNKTTTP